MRTQNISPVSIVTATLISLLLTVLPAAADVETADVASGFFRHEFGVGYRYADTDKNNLRAREYDSQTSSTTGEVDIAVVDDWGHLNIAGTYLNDKDYSANAHIEVGSNMRFNLRTQSLFHNLDHIPYDPSDPNARLDKYLIDATVDPVSYPEPAEPVPGTDAATVRFTDHNAGDVYGVQVRENLVEAKFKPGDYPAHLNLSYWSWEKEGTKQQRWVDENCGGCHMQSQSRQINRITEEIKGSVDAHLGALDLILEQTYRQFRTDEEIPEDTFGFHVLRAPGDREHDEDPESRFMSTTLKAHTSFAGGLSAAASATLSKSENESKVTDVYPIKSETDTFTSALDFTWIPTGKFTLTMRGNYLDLENKNSETITAEGMSAFGFPRTDISVRDNIDREQYSGSTTLTFRPTRKVSVKYEHSYREIKRSNTGGPQPFSGFALINDEVWELPAKEIQTKNKLSFYVRPLQNGRLKIRGGYQFAHSSDAAYGASLDEEHASSLGVEYSPSLLWGAAVNAKHTQGSNKAHSTVIEDGSADEEEFLRDRDETTLSVTANTWLNPSETVTLGAHYGYLRTDIEQDLLLGTEIDTGRAAPYDVQPHIDRANFAVFDDDVEYEQTVNTASLFFNWRLLPQLLFRSEGRAIFSESAYDPNFSDRLLDYEYETDDPSTPAVEPTEVHFPAVATSNGLKEITQVKIEQFGISAGLDWDISDTIRCGFNYTYDKYDDKIRDYYDGSVQTYMASVAKRW